MGTDAGGVDQPIQSLPTVLGQCDRLFAQNRIGNISRQDEDRRGTQGGQLANLLLQQFTATRDEQQPGSPPGQLPGQGKTDATGSTRDENTTIGKGWTGHGT